MGAFGGGGSLITTMPSSPWPKSVECQDVYIAGVNQNPFTGQQQTQDYQTRYKEVSFSYASQSQSNAQALIAFLESLSGVINVFQVPAALAAKYPEIFIVTGTTQRYWRLKGNVTKWSVKPGVAYPPITFEAREAI